jgi:RNA methyltransferase, TrmH family
MHQQHLVEQTIARVRRLQKSRIARDRAGQFWIEGVRQFLRAADAGLKFDMIVYSRILLKQDDAHARLRILREHHVPCIGVAPEQFRRLSIAPHASGIGAIVKYHLTPINRADPYRGLCWLVLEHIRSPGNLGTILRTAEATGVSGVVFLGRDCDPFDPAVVRASMGGIFHLQLVRTTHERFARWARGLGIELIGLAPGAQKLWTVLPYVAPTALAIGEERRGLSERLSQICTSVVRLPMTGHTDSLNVAVATGVVLYELIRRIAAATAAPASLSDPAPQTGDCDWRTSGSPHAGPPPKNPATTSG